MSFKTVTEFENKIAEFYGSPYAVSVDCCTHAIELCLRYLEVDSIEVPKQTYISIPLLSKKLNIDLKWKDEDWLNYYTIGGTNVIDAAVYWKENSYVPGNFMCLSFQFRKHFVFTCFVRVAWNTCWRCMFGAGSAEMKFPLCMTIW